MVKRKSYVFILGIYSVFVFYLPYYNFKKILTTASEKTNRKEFLSHGFSLHRYVVTHYVFYLNNLSEALHVGLSISPKFKNFQNWSKRHGDFLASFQEKIREF